MAQPRRNNNRRNRNRWRQANRNNPANRRANPNNRITVLRVPTIFPDTTITTLVYRISIQMVDLDGTGAYAFAMNSIFEPDQSTSSSNQPLGHDQWAAFYGRYEVIASTIKVSPGSNLRDPVRCTVYPSRVNATGDPETSAEQPYAKSIVFSFTSRSATTISNSMNVSKFEGRSTASINYTSTFGSNPAFMRYWQVSLDALGADLTDDISDVRTDIEIRYRCKFFQRLNLMASIS